MTALLLFWAAVPAAVCAAILFNSRARRRRLIAEIEKEEAKNEIWFKGVKDQMRLFQNDMRLLEEQAKNATPGPEPAAPRKTAGKKEFTVQNVVNLLELCGLHVEHIDEICPGLDPFVSLKADPETEREVCAIGLTVSPKGRFIRAKKIRRRFHGF